MAKRQPEKKKAKKSEPRGKSRSAERPREVPKEHIFEEGQPSGRGQQRTPEDFSGIPIGSDPRE